MDKQKYTMLENQNYIFHKEVLQKLLQLSPANQAQLISKVRKHREERINQELKTITQSQQKVQQRFTNSNMIKYLKHSYPYHPKQLLTQPIRDKLMRCLHYHYFQSTNTDICVICHVQLVSGCTMVMLGCSHHYHIQCIENWFKNSIICPLCKDTTISNVESQRIKQAEDEIKQLNINRTAIINRNNTTTELLQFAFLSKLKPSSQPTNYK